MNDTPVIVGADSRNLDAWTPPLPQKAPDRVPRFREDRPGRRKGEARRTMTNMTFPPGLMTKHDIS